MTPQDRLAALSGAWLTQRVIRHADGGVARFEGTSVWAPAETGLRCEETGLLSMAGAAPFTASRTTLWGLHDGAIEVAFADGRPFHRIDGPWAHHDCAPDTYLLGYDWGNWPRWTVRWRVTGPRKDYRALTRYRRV